MMEGMKEKKVLEDVRKLHSEVNQIVNQRFLLTTLAVTVFGVVTAWFIPKSSVGGFASCVDAWFSYCAALFLLVILFVLYVVSHTLKNTLRSITAYLQVFSLSEWESRWSKFRENGYHAYTRTQTLFFIALGVLDAIFYILVNRPPIIPSWQLVVGIFALCIYIILLCGMGFCGWWDSEASAKKRWEKIKSDE